MIDDIPEKYLKAVARLMLDSSVDEDMKFQIVEPAARWYAVSKQAIFDAAETYLPSTEDSDHDTNGTA